MVANESNNQIKPINLNAPTNQGATIKFESILSLITHEPQTVAQIAAQAGIKPQLCAGYLRTLHRAGKVHLGVMKKSHSKDINTYRLIEPLKRLPQQREDYQPGPLPLRYVPREGSYYSFYSGVVHTQGNRG